MTGGWEGWVYEYAGTQGLEVEGGNEMEMIGIGKFCVNDAVELEGKLQDTSLL